jgi:hypothetical protein
MNDPISFTVNSSEALAEGDFRPRYWYARKHLGMDQQAAKEYATPPTRKGRYRVWVVRNPPSPKQTYPVRSPWHGAVLIAALAESDLLDPLVTTNVFGLQQFVEGDWEDWYNDEGYDEQQAYEAQIEALGLHEGG